MFVKVCGVAGPADVDAAAAAGVDAVGLVLSRASVRRLEPEVARRIAAHVRPPMISVVVVDDMGAADAARVTAEIGADALQLHGAYTAADFAAAARPGVRLWRATSLSPDVDLRVGAYGEELLLLDSPRAGSGRTWDLSALTEGHRPGGRWLLAGGLSPDNVADALARARPWGVDVSSGVESAPGVKDHARIAAFAAAAHGVTPA